MARKKEPARKGRPPVEIDIVQLAALGAMHATHEEIAAFYNCDRRTVINRLKIPEYLLAYENGKLRGKLNLRRLQWRHAQGIGSSAVNMTIHLSKHWLGETDNGPSTTLIQNNNTLALTHASESDLRALESILARIANASASEGRVIEAGSSSPAPAG